MRLGEASVEYTDDALLAMAGVGVTSIDENLT
jgi:hypothetical protein